MFLFQQHFITICYTIHSDSYVLCHFILSQKQTSAQFQKKHQYEYWIPDIFCKFPVYYKMFSTLCETKNVYKYRCHTLITYLVSKQHGMSVAEKCTWEKTFNK